MVRKKRSSKINIALVGAGSRGYSILELLRDVEDVDIVGVADIDESAPGMKLAKKLGIKTTTDFLNLLDNEKLDLIIEVTGDPSVREAILEKKSAQAGLLGTAGAELVWDLLKARQKGKQQERLYAALRVAYEKIRQHEKELESSKKAVEEANTELEKRLAEIFFVHEFFKALTSCTTVEETIELIADGACGILGTDVSCVYLWDGKEKAYLLKAWRGREEKSFYKVIEPDEENIVVLASNDGTLKAYIIQSKDSFPKSFLRDSSGVPSQIATPLKIKDQILGVLCVASPSYRVLTTEERERLINIAYMSSLALQNALFNRELERLSVTDSLTGLYNYGHFRNRLAEEMERAKRFNHSLSVVMIDVDYFKRFNDKFGHIVGDQVLKRVAEILRANTREIDTAARYGGEEFVLILPETCKEDAIEVAERIRRVIEEQGFGVGRGLRAKETISLGVASYPEDAQDAQKLVEKADKALYEAKKRGRNRVIAAG